MIQSQLPSSLQPRDWCSVNFGSAGKIDFARVTKVMFTESSVFYDVEVPVATDPIERILENGVPTNVNGWTRAHSIASVFINKLEPVEKEWFHKSELTLDNYGNVTGALVQDIPVTSEVIHTPLDMIKFADAVSYDKEENGKTTTEMKYARWVINSK